RQAGRGPATGAAGALPRAALRRPDARPDRPDAAGFRKAGAGRLLALSAAPGGGAGPPTPRREEKTKNDSRTARQRHTARGGGDPPLRLSDRSATHDKRRSDETEPGAIREGRQAAGGLLNQFCLTSADRGLRGRPASAPRGSGAALRGTAGACSRES